MHMYNLHHAPVPPSPCTFTTFTMHLHPLAPRSGSSVDSYSKERAGDLVDHWLIYMAAESVVQNIGVIVASSTNKDVRISSLCSLCSLALCSLLCAH